MHCFIGASRDEQIGGRSNGMNFGRAVDVPNARFDLQTDDHCPSTFSKASVLCRIIILDC